jgi:hypothetical protein
VCASQLHGLDNGHPLTQTSSPVYLCFLRAQAFLPLYICVSAPPSRHALVGMLSLVCIAHVMMCYCYSCIPVFSQVESKNLVGIFLCIFVKKKLMSAISEVQGTTAGVGMLGVMVRAVCLRFVFSVHTRAHATFVPSCQRKQPFTSVAVFRQPHSQSYIV